MLPSHPSTTPRPPEGEASARSTLVLLHGLPMGAWMWHPQLPLLADHYRILAPDLPGFGAAGTNEPFSMDRAAAAIIHLLRASESGPAHLCGLSLGAMVALQVYQSAPELVASLILSGGQVHPNRLLMIVQELAVSLIPEHALTDEVPSQLQRYPELEVEALASAHQTSKRSVGTTLRTIANVDFRRLVPTIRVPTLVLCGANDRPNLPASRQMAAAIPGAELQVIPGVGHIWNLEQPDLFGQMVLAFAQRVDAERRT